jgi:hypothetical protein
MIDITTEKPQARIKLVPPEKKLLNYGGVLYSKPGLTLAHLRRNEKETDLFRTLIDLQTMINENLPLERRLSERKISNKSHKIYREIVDKYFTDEITKFYQMCDTPEKEAATRA